MKGWGRLLVGLAIAATGCGDDGETEYDSGGASGKSDYADSGFRCGMFPRVAVDTVDGLCVGLVATANDTNFKPRVLLELPGRPGEFLVSDLANWKPGRGRLWYLDARNPEELVLEVALDGLTVPHQVVMGPDNLVYYGEDDAISAFPLSALDDLKIEPAEIEVIIGDLPAMDVDGERNSMHPISHFVFDGDGDMFVNIGAYTDHCDDYVGRECQEADRRLGGESADPRDWGGVIRRYDRVEGHTWNADYDVVAYGLRNSMGLVFTPGGDLIQVENGRDFDEGGRPFEELNVIPLAELEGEEPPKHYGWPYCYDAYETSDEWVGYEGFPCSPDNPDYRPPHILLPPHGAPLGVAYYDGDMFDELEGQLIVPLHGYRAPGQRMLAFEVDETGLPIRSENAFYLENPTEGGESAERPYPVSEFGLFSAPATYLVNAWFEVDGFRPKGAPVAPYIASDGALWVADDKNRTILRFDRAEGALPPLRRENLYPAARRALDNDPELLGLYDEVVDKVLTSRQCEGCHDDYLLAGDESRYPQMRYLLALGSWIAPGEPMGSALYTKLIPVGEASMPPLGREWDSDVQGNEAANAVQRFISALPALEPWVNDGWIGGECLAGHDEDCPFEDGACIEDGVCTVACTTDYPFCPDRDGMRGTFCVDLGDGTGGCVVTCDPEAPDCLPGQECVPEVRFGRTSPTRNVCR